jgi:rhodanese-related sulfurtransferase
VSLLRLPHQSAFQPGRALRSTGAPATIPATGEREARDVQFDRRSKERGRSLCEEGATMDSEGRFSVSPRALYSRLGSAVAPVVIDVRDTRAFEADERMIVGALRRDPHRIEEWWRELPAERPIIVYGAESGTRSRDAAALLRGSGRDVRWLEGGIAGWTALGLPRCRKGGARPGKWVTRERPKIDRIACPWLIRRFIDPAAEFLYVPSERVLAIAAEVGATAFDIPGAEPFAHRGGSCSFDAFLEIYGIDDPGLDALASIVRGADTARLDLTPQSPGLLAISLGLSALHADDHAMLEHGMTVYDALHAWCRGEAQDANPSARPA